MMAKSKPILLLDDSFLRPADTRAYTHAKPALLFWPLDFATAAHSFVLQMFVPTPYLVFRVSRTNVVELPCLAEC